MNGSSPQSAIDFVKNDVSFNEPENLDSDDSVEYAYSGYSKTNVSYTSEISNSEEEGDSYTSEISNSEEEGDSSILFQSLESNYDDDDDAADKVLSGVSDIIDKLTSCTEEECDEDAEVSSVGDEQVLPAIGSSEESVLNSDTVQQENVRGSFSSAVHKDGRKKHCCLYCSKWWYKMPRHLKSKHRFEGEVADLLQLPAQERNRGLTVLVRRGDFEANMKVARESSELVAVV